MAEAGIALGRIPASAILFITSPYADCLIAVATPMLTAALPMESNGLLKCTACVGRKGFRLCQHFSIFLQVIGLSVNREKTCLHNAGFRI